MKYMVRVINKKNGMNCFIYPNATLENLNYILQCLSNLDTNLYQINIEREEE